MYVVTFLFFFIVLEIMKRESIAIKLSRLIHVFLPLFFLWL